MTDNKRKKKADGKRVALTQEHEREYLIKQLDRMEHLMSEAVVGLYAARHRLRSGFPATKGKRRGK